MVTTRSILRRYVRAELSGVLRVAKGMPLEYVFDMADYHNL